MSSLIFWTDPEQALVVTDTLAVTPAGLPSTYCSKAIYLPHLRTIIAGTGVGMFSGDWAMAVNNRLIVKGIQNLDYHTPNGLRELWQRYATEHSVPEDLTTTVYHFGFAEDGGSIHSYAYRSTNNFISERVPYGTGVKPPCTVPEPEHLVESLHSMMKEQRALQLARPDRERVYIGGQGIMMHLTRSGCHTSTAFQFDDYEAQWDDMMRHRTMGPE